MHKTEAIDRIEAIFAQYKSLRPSDNNHLNALSKGKLYELYVLSRLVKNLSGRGFHLAFRHQSLAFKSAPGKIKRADPHFLVTAPNGRRSRIFVNIEFETYGYSMLSSATRGDLSRNHELDLVVVSETKPNPQPEHVLLAVECKCVATFDKSIVREVLGLRRELSLLSDRRPTTLTEMGGTPAIYVPARPPSELWLAFTDPDGLKYSHSPSQFGIDFRHIPLP